MEGDNDYENLLEFGLESLNLPEETSRDVDQFFNRIPDINAGRSEVGGALAKWCTKRLLVSFMVSPEKLKVVSTTMSSQLPLISHLVLTDMLL